MKKLIFFILFITCFAYGQSTPSPNMGLPIPQVGVTPGPDWANNINSSLSIIDAHDHTPGNGVPITPLAMNINSDLTCNDNNLISLRSSRYQPQGSPLSGASDLGAVYVSGVDLYYNDGNGNQVRITQGGSVTGASGSITGLTPPASASYVSGTQTFVWQSDVNTAANMDFRNATLRNSAANSFGLTLQPPPGMSSDSTIVFPTLPAATSFLQMDVSGNMAASIPVLGALTTSNLSPTANIIGSQLSASAGIVGTQLANNTITLTQLDNTILQWNSSIISTPVASFTVKTATTANITLSGTQTIDGIAVIANDKVLVKNQTTSSQDGVYDVAAGAWSRDASYNTFSQLNNAMIKVTGFANGQTQGGSTWFQNNILASLVDPQSWSVTSNAQTFTVPANVNGIRIFYCGGGGGGGGGAGASSGQGPRAGGGGGGGSTPYEVFLSVTPGLVFTVTPGAGGSPGNGGTNLDGNGVNGGNGTDTIISATGINLTGRGASQGTASTTSAAGVGGTTYVDTSVFAGFSPGAGGNGSNTPATDGSPGGVNYYSGIISSAGGHTSLGRGGGGGGPGFGPGGAGGGGAGSGTAGRSAGSDAPSMCAGGGGAGGSGVSAGQGTNGGAGGSGMVKFFWLGHP